EAGIPHRASAKRARKTRRCLREAQRAVGRAPRRRRRRERTSRRSGSDSSEVPRARLTPGGDRYMRRTAFGAPPSLEDIAAMRMPLRRLLLVPAAFLVVLGAPAFASGPAQLPVPTNREFALSAPGEAASPG